MIFAGQGSDFEAQTLILDARGAIVRMSLKMVIFNEKNEFDNPPHGSAHSMTPCDDYSVPSKNEKIKYLPPVHGSW